MECDKIAKDFASILDELTCNSKPIISTLTKMAEENIGCAQQMVDAIERRIERCVPNQKLYAFYVLDSICKNAGSPYTIYFSRNLAQLYKRTYLIVDNQTRSDLIKMFKTWLMPSSSSMGDHLFGKEALDAIERFLVKASALHQKHVAAPTVPGLLREIDKLSLLTRERAAQNPHDAKLKTKVVVLQQLKQELQREKMPPQALQQVQMQLRQIFAQEQQVLQQQHQQQQLQHQHQQQRLPRKALSTPPPQAPGATPAPRESEPVSLFGTPSLSSSFFPNASNIQPPTSEPSQKASKVQALYDTLRAEGLVKPVPQQSVVTLDRILSQNHKESAQTTLPPLNLLKDILGDVQSHFSTVGVDILNTPNLQLCQQTVIQDNPTVMQLRHLLYRYKPNKCSTCGKRFGSSEEEKKQERDHLDWHFRINKRIKGTAGANGATAKNIQSRNWYLDDTQWQRFNDEEIVSTTRSETDSVTLANLDASTASSSFSTSKFDAKSAPEKTEADLAKKYVTVPETHEDMSFQCPICREVQSAVYNDDIGEWIWPNCIQSQGKYFHSTCFHEAVEETPQQALNQGLERLKGLAG
ncbi:Pcf11p [Lachancea thermotolerans CBS 6340]|uniref:KLTH0E10318p n=1 Tax=Lachancea thermotolerans (strain ATCC 56472 / CBS 6340 / NRRL Y-8284) TaxID=559295 RepID=C5DI76_LACTC|nr:KLTH0E10318p [Lachancea thermotolerans CBS 6340]CAR23487.1 KLTH0E10318p [Lachancea thermotolerans CBS 6340]